jgi:hypothetical protein
MLNLLLFVVLNGFVFAGAVLLARFAFGMRDRLACALAAAIAGWVYIVVGLQVLGLAGQIRVIPCLGLASVALACGVGACLAAQQRTRVSAERGLDTLTRRASEGPTGAGTASKDRGTVDLPVDDQSPPYASRIVLWSLVAVAALTCWATLDVLMNSLAGPVLPVSDAPIYHLYFAVRWWQSGHIDLVPTPFGESAAPYFPANANLWFTWLLVPWSSEVAAKVGQWPFLWLTMAAVFGIALELGTGRAPAACAAALWGTATLPLLNAGFADVDLVMTGMYVAGIYFLVRYVRTNAASDLLCCALGLGAALGTKTISVLFVPAPFIAAAAATRHSPHRWRHVTLLAFGVLLPAIYWYARNLLLTGNPLYPLHQEFLGFTLLNGWYRRETLFASGYHIDIANTRALFRLLLRGMDPILIPWWVGGFLVALWSRGRRHLLTAMLIALAVLHIVLYWYVNPYQTQDRFLFPAFALLAIPVALLIDRVPLLIVPFAALLMLHMVVGSEPLLGWIGIAPGTGAASGLPPLLPVPLRLFGDSWANTIANRVFVGRFIVLAAVLPAAVLVAIALRSRLRATWFALAFVVLAGGLAARAIYSRIPDAYAPLRFIPVAPQIGYTPGWLALEERSDRPLRVAYAGTNLPYYLFGSRLQNTVQYVNIDRHPTFAMHDYHRRYFDRGVGLATSPTPDWDRREPDESAWLENMRNQQIDLLFVGFVNRSGGMHNVYDSEGFPIERTWADNNPQLFQPIHIDPRTRLYAVKAASLRIDAR